MTKMRISLTLAAGQGILPLIILGALFVTHVTAVQAQQVMLTWSPNPEPDVAFYRIYRAPISSPTAEIACVPASETSFVDGNITSGLVYYYRISAVDSANNVSEFSEEILVSTDLVTGIEMQSFIAEFIENGVLLTWAILDEAPCEGYEIERSRGNQAFETIGYVESKHESKTVNTYSFQDTDVSKGKYFYRLQRIELTGEKTKSAMVSVEVDLPGQFELNQNFPNPFNSATEFNYAIAKGGVASLTIYDIRGRQVRKLFEEAKAPGRYRVRWDGKNDSAQDVASGIYFARLTGRGFSQTRKLLLQK